MATISENLQTLIQTKEDIKTALTNKGVSVSNKLIDVPDEIDSIQTGSTPVLDSITITSNGTYTPPAGIDGYNNITVNVSGGTVENIQVKVWFPDNNVASRCWKSAAFKIGYYDLSTADPHIKTVSRSGSGSGTDAKFNYYTVPKGSVIVTDPDNSQNTGTIYFSDDGGANFTTAYVSVYPKVDTISYTPYGGSATPLQIKQSVMATTADQEIALCYSETN